MEKKFKKILSSVAVLILVLAMLPLSNIANEVAVEPDVVQPQQATNDEAAMPNEEEKKPAEEADRTFGVLLSVNGSAGGNWRNFRAFVLCNQIDALLYAFLLCRVLVWSV